MPRIFFLILLVAGWSIEASGQNALKVLRGNTPKSDLLFERLGTREGLPDNRIRSFYEDHRGFLWVGTMNGLGRYDGYQFTLYSKNKAGTGLAGNWAYAVSEDSAHMVWIGTREGLSRFDPSRETFTNYRNSPNQPTSLLSNQINTLSFDVRGKLWIGTPEGLTVFDPRRQTFRRFNQFPLNKAIGKLIRSAGDIMWVATAAGPVRYNVRTDTYTLYPLPLHANAYGDRIWSLLEDHGNLYLATAADGLLRLPYDARTQTYGAFEPCTDFAGAPQALRNTEVFDLCKSPAGDLWLGTSQGLARIEGVDTPGRRLRFYRHNPLNDQSLSNNSVYKVFIDRNNVLWCGTEHGISKLDLHLLPFEFVSFIGPQGDDQVRSIAADSQSVWLGTFKSGFYRYSLADGSTHNYQFTPGPTLLNAHRAMLLAPPGELWLGTLAGTVRVPLARPTTFTLLPGPAVFSLLTDTRHNRWVGTNRGLFKLTADSRQVAYPLNRTAPPTRDGEFVRAMYEDQHGRLWVGFENKGLYQLNTETGHFTRIETDSRGEKLLGSTIYAISESPRNVLWASSESGLSRITIRPGGDYHIRNYTTSDGLPDQSVNSVQVDTVGNLWLGSIKGLVRYQPASGQFQTFLPNHSFSYSCSSKGHGRELLFGTVNGFIRFDPTAIRRDTTPPVVALTDLRLANKPVGIGQVFNRDTVLRQALASTHQITLNYLNNGFTLGFSALHFASPETNTYAYKLDGYDPDWVFTNARNRSATYTNLDPGTYTFRVKAANGPEQWSTQPATLVVTVAPAPWKSGWAYALYALALCGLLAAVVRYLLAQNRQRQQIRFAQLEQQRLEHLNQLKLEFFTDISHEFRTPITLIAGPVEALLASGSVAGVVRQQMQLVQRNCRKLLSLIDELMTFQKLEQGMVKLRPERLDLLAFVREIFIQFKPLAEAKGLDFQLDLHAEALPVSFDPDKLEKVINNLLSNAVKFTPPGGTVRLSTALAGPEHAPDGQTAGVLLAVTDTGKGITAPEQQHLFERFFQSETNRGGTGVGLSLTKSLVELHDGRIMAESEPNVRTCFTVFLPLEQAGAAASGPLLPSLPIAWPAMSTPIALAQTSVLPSPIARPDGADDHRPELLVVDDNAEVLDFINLIFCEQYVVTKAENGQQALDLIRQREPDLIISDVMMPVMDGFALCRTLKADVLTSHIPLVLLTAQSTLDSRLIGAGLGADEYIPKPFHPELLRVRVAKMIEAHQRLIEKYRAGAEVSPQALAHNPLDEAFLQKVLDVVAANFSNEEFSVEELSSHVNMSRSHLFRKLKALTGQTPLELIYHQRLKHARQLLLERRLNISEITAEVGFKTPSSFSKSFRKQYGKSPTDYLNDALLEQHGSNLSPAASASPTSRG